MNTIKNYLDNMFLGLPQNENILKAKEELLNMMEDKYNELKNSGKTENECIGIVISEFGNLSEISDALGIKNIVEQKSEIPTISYEKAKNYLDDSKNIAPKTAMGVMLCILSPVVLLILIGLSSIKSNVSGFVLNENRAIAIGLFVILLMVAYGVSYFLRYTSKLNNYDELQKIAFILDHKTQQMVIKTKKLEEPIYNKALTISVTAYILSALPILMSSLLIDRDGVNILSVAITLIIVALSTYNIIKNNGTRTACIVLLQMEDYSISEKSKNLEAISRIYWSITVAIYLGYSFITGNWHKSWIIWPVAGVLYVAIEAVAKNIKTKSN